MAGAPRNYCQLGAEATQAALQHNSRRFQYLNVLLVDNDLADTSLILGVLKRHSNLSTAYATDAPGSPYTNLRSLSGLRQTSSCSTSTGPRSTGSIFSKDCAKSRPWRKSRSRS